MIKQVKRGKQTLSSMPLSSREREENRTKYGRNMTSCYKSCHEIKDSSIEISLDGLQNVR